MSACSGPMSHVKLVTCAPVERSAVSCCCVSKPPRTHNWQSRLSRLNFSKAATPAVDHAKKIMFPLLRRDDLAVCDYSQGTVHFTRVRLSAILATRSNVPSWPNPVRWHTALLQVPYSDSTAMTPDVGNTCEHLPCLNAPVQS